jgi:NAD(P)-dependent dehydrogenase (short-subunit alcohol dehydrogenase family)
MNEQPPKLAIVTGAGSGLGRAFCQCLAATKSRWRLIAVDIDEQAARRTLNELALSPHVSGSWEPLDVSQASPWFELRERLQCEFARLDLLVNNAGVCMSAEVGEGDLAAWRRIHEVNYLGVLNGCHAMVPWLKQSAGGISARDPVMPKFAEASSRPPKPAVINVASIMGLLPAPSIAAYSASKAAVVALSEAMYAELRPRGVNVTVAAPGFFASSLLDRGDFASPCHREQADDLVRSSKIDADTVAREALAASAEGRLYAVMGARARSFWRLKRLAPTMVLNSLSRGYERMMNAAANADPPAD